MPQRADGTVALLPEPGPRWSVPGGEQDDDTHVLHVITVAEDGTTRRWRVALPIRVHDDGAIHVMPPVVEEA